MKRNLLKILTFILGIIFCLSAAACTPQDTGDPVKSITISGPAQLDTESGTVQYTAQITNGSEGDEAVFTLETAAPTVAEITQSGLLTVKGVGTVVVVATLSTNASISAKKTVTIDEAANQNTAFVDMRDGKFYIGDEEFRFMGTNNYGMHYKSEAMIDDVLTQCQDMGIKVVRMWGFFDGWNDEGRANYAYMQTMPGSYDSPKEAFGETLYYRDDPTRERIPVSCFDVMDYSIKRAGQKGIRLLITLTNYYTEFGGMEQYVRWYNQLNPDNPVGKSDFYTNETIKGWYKDFVRTVITRENELTGVAYKDDPTIFAWELCNEPEGGQDLIDWSDEMSKYIKSIDPNHMVSVGAQGGINKGEPETITWEGADGETKSYELTRQNQYSGTRYNVTVGAKSGTSGEELMKLEEVDFGTIHLYPDHWGINRSRAIEYGEQYIKDNIALGHKYGKPLVLEEYGSMRPDLTDSKRFNRVLAYDVWNQAVLDMDGAASMFWTLTGIDDSEGADAQGMYPDYDGFRVMNDGSEDAELLKEFAAVFNGEKSEIDRSTPKAYWLNPLISEVVKTYQEDPSAVSVVSGSDNTLSIEVKIVPNGKTVESVKLYVNNNSEDPESTAKKDTLLNMTETSAGSGIYRNTELKLTDLNPGEIYTIKAEAYFTDDTSVDLPAKNIKRYVKLELEELYTLDFDADQSFSFMIFGSYQAQMHAGYPKHNKEDGVLELNVTDGSAWSEHKVKFVGLPNTSEGNPLIPQTYRVQFTLYYEYDANASGTFMHYIALEPGWIKVAMGKNDISISTLKAKYREAGLTDPADPATPYGVTKKTFHGDADKLWFYQTVTIEFTPDASLNALCICPTTRNFDYSGFILIDDVIFSGYSGEIPVDSLEPDDFEIPSFEW